MTQPRSPEQHQPGNSEHLQRVREMRSDILDTIHNSRGEVFWTEAEAGKTRHEPLVSHIIKGAAPNKNKKTRAYYGGLDVAKQQVHKFLKSAEKDEASLAALTQNWSDGDGLTRELAKPNSVAVDAIKDFWVSVALRMNQRRDESELETVVMSEANEALDTLLNSDSNDPAKEFIAVSALRNARRRKLHFSTESKLIERKLSKSPPKKSLGTTAVAGTLQDDYVREAREKADKINR